MAAMQSGTCKFTATQWFKDGDHPDVYMLMGDACVEQPGSVIPLDVRPGDWIVEFPSGAVSVFGQEDYDEFLKEAE